MLYLSEYTQTTSKEDKQKEHDLGRSLLQQGLELEYGRTWKIDVKKGGKPYLPDAENVHFNISHTKGLVICGISEREIGVDVERIRKFKEPLLRKVCSEEERQYVLSTEDTEERAMRFCQLWTLKESYIKATGQGLSFPLNKVSFTVTASGMHDEVTKEAGLVLVSREIQSNVSGWSFCQYRFGEQYMVAVCEALS